MRETIAAALAREYASAKSAVDRGATAAAWHHLERAHILAQTALVPHLVSHGRMLRLAVAQRDAREAAGQLLRLALAPFGHLAGRLPIGNTGRSKVSAFAPMELPPDLRAIIEDGSG